MSYELRKIDQLPKWALVDLVTLYDVYIKEFFNENLQLEGEVPVSVQKFYENEFLGYAEEQEVSWQLYHVRLQYSLKKKEDCYVDVTAEGLTFTVVVPEEVYYSKDYVLKDYIEAEHGETIFNIMNAVNEIE